MRDPQLFGPWFADRASWRPWETFLAALFGLPFDEDSAAALFSQHTGRTVPPTQPAREAWVIVGRRGGKSRIAALVALYLACFRDYRGTFAPGEVGTLPVIAADRRQARTVMRYITGFLDEVPMLRQLVTNRTKETIELANRVTIEVHTANFRAVRGYSLIGVVCDEIAFWSTDEGGANPDTEILNGLRPGMATVAGAVLLAISSPYARRGALWEAYRRHFGQDGDPVLVWQADTRSMNPAVDPQLIADAYAADDVAAAAE
jgi:phage terminase large subunit-like protein